MGLQSHGIIRVPQYLDEIRRGVIDPVARPVIDRVAPGRLAADGRGGFGQVAGMALVEGVVPVARECGSRSWSAAGWVTRAGSAPIPTRSRGQA